MPQRTHLRLVSFNQSDFRFQAGWRIPKIRHICENSFLSILVVSKISEFCIGGFDYLFGRLIWSKKRLRIGIQASTEGRGTKNPLHAEQE